MKLTIDTEEKTLIIKDKTPLGDLIKQLDSMFPNKEWMEYTIFDKESSEQWFTGWSGVTDTSKFNHNNNPFQLHTSIK